MLATADNPVVSEVRARTWTDHIKGLSTMLLAMYEGEVTDEAWAEFLDRID